MEMEMWSYRLLLF